MKSRPWNYTKKTKTEKRGESKKDSLFELLMFVLFSGTHAPVHHLPPQLACSILASIYAEHPWLAIYSISYNKASCLSFSPKKIRKKENTPTLLARIYITKTKKFSWSKEKRKVCIPAPAALNVFPELPRGRVPSSFLRCFAFFLSPLHTAPGLSFRAASRRRQGERPPLARSSSGDSTPKSIREVCPPTPFPFLRAARNRTPQTPMYAICTRIWPCVLPAKLRCFCKNYRPCPILGPPLLASWLIQICALTVRRCSALAHFSLFRTRLGEKFTCLQCLAYYFST